MNSKRSSGLDEGDGASGRRVDARNSSSKADARKDDAAEDDSIETSLNQILAEADSESPKAASDVLVETSPGGDPEEAVVSAATPPPAAEPGLVTQDPLVQVRTPEELASMSGPALVDDAKEEVTDVESPEALAALAASSSKASGGAEPAVETAEAPSTDGGGTPVREALTASLLKASVPQEEIVTATGGGSPSNNDVITAENVGFFNPPSEVRRKDEAESSAAGDEASTADLPLSDKAREERDRVMRRSRPPTPATPLPRFGEGGAGDEPEAELELSDLDYDRQRSPAPLLPSDDDGPSSRRPGADSAWPLAAPASDSGPVRRTPPPFSASITGTGRHSLPPPVTPVPGSPARGRLPTPHTVSALGAQGQRNSSPAIPIQAPIGASGPLSMTRSTSAVFNKVQLPLGGLVTVVGAAFGVGLIIGAVLWRGAAEGGAETTAVQAGGEARSAPPAAEPQPAPAPAPVAATPPPAPAPAPVAPTPPAPAAVEPPGPAAQPATEVAGAGSAAASGGPATASDTMGAAAKKVAAASLKPQPRPKRPPAAPGAVGIPAPKGDAPAGKAKPATWVDPFAQ